MKESWAPWQGPGPTGWRPSQLLESEISGGTEDSHRHLGRKLPNIVKGKQQKHSGKKSTRICLNYYSQSGGK